MCFKLYLTIYLQLYLYLFSVIFLIINHIRILLAKNKFLNIQIF